MNKCLCCGKKINVKGLGRHISTKHGLSSKEYYDKYLKKENEGFCLNCKNETKFRRISCGYSKFCSPKCQNSNNFNPMKNHEYLEKTIQKMSKSHLGIKSYNFGKHLSEKQRLKISFSLKEYYKNNVNINRIMHRIPSPTKLEIKISELISFLKLTSIKMNTECQVATIKNRIPDFIDTEHKLIIEAYGDFWHANPKKYKSSDIVYDDKTAKEIWEHDSLRIKELETVGYKILIIWEYELKNKERVKQKMLKFVNKYIQTKI